VKTVLKFQLNAFSRTTQNASAKMSKEENQMIFLKEGQTIVGYW